LLAAKGLSTRFARKVADAFARSFAGTLRYWESSHLFRRASHFLESLSHLFFELRILRSAHATGVF
jgi:hypothetical protein